jgi:hypothetical protein
MKKLISLFLVFMLLVTVVPFNALADTDSAGITVGYDLGKNFQITYDKTSKTLTVQGKGCFGKLGFSELYNYNLGNPMYWDEIALDNTKTIVISEGITGIDDYAFIGFQNVETLILPNSMKHIGKCAFFDLIKLKSIQGGKNVTQIDGGAFMDCKNLKNISFPNLQKLDDNEVKLFSHYNGFEDGTDVCLIGDYYSPWVYVGAFMHCQNLESVYIPKVKKFGDRTFFDCQKLKTINKNNILNNVTSLGVSVFHNCKSLKNISLPNATTLNSGRVVDEDTLKGKKSFIEGTFSNCYSLESVNIPKAKVIGADTFYQCKKLKKINANNKLNNVTYLGAGAFAKCENLETITLPKVDGLYMLKWAEHDVTDITKNSAGHYYGEFESHFLGYKYHGTFEGCTRLKSISVPNVKTVGARTFYSCKSLKKISLPKVKELGSSAFFNCTNLSTVNIPKLKKLHSSAWKVYKQNPNKKYTLIETPYYRGTFEKCVKLKKITSSSLANVGKYDFKDCTRLESITLGKNLKSIGDSAFNNNRKLKSVNIKSTKLSKVGKSAFSKIHSKAKFTVPKSKLKKYKKLIKSNGKAPKNVKFIAK